MYFILHGNFEDFYSVVAVTQWAGHFKDDLKFMSMFVLFKNFLGPYYRNFLWEEEQIFPI